MGTSAVCTVCGRKFDVPGAIPDPAVCPACAAAAQAAPHGAVSLQDAVDAALDEASLRPFLPRAVDFFLDKVQGLLSEAAFRTVTRLALLAGEIGTYLAVILFAIAVLITALRANSLTMALVGAGTCAGAILALYIALKLIVAGFGVLRATPSFLSSRAYLNCFAVLLLLAAGGCFLYPFIGIREHSGADLIVPFIIAWLAIPPFLLGALLALNPALLNITVTATATAGETFLGLISFLLKASLALLPVQLAILALMTALTSLVAIGYELFSGAGSSFETQNSGAVALESAVTLLGWTVLAPIVTVLAFLLYYLVVDLCQAVLTIPKLKEVLK